MTPIDAFPPPSADSARLCEEWTGVLIRTLVSICLTAFSSYNNTTKEDSLERLRVIHVGTAGRGRYWVQGLRGCESFVKQVALVDVRPDLLEKAQEITGLSSTACFSDLGSALVQVAADAVVIVTPSAFHASLAHQALSAGKHVLLEKPFTNNYYDAWNIVARAQQQGLKVVVAQNYRYSPTERLIQKLLRDETYGQVGYLSLIHHRYRPDPRAFTMDEPMLWEMSCHHFDSILAFFGDRPVSRVAARSFNPPWSRYPGSAAVSAIIEIDGRIQVNYSGTFTSMSDHREYRFECAEGALVWDENGLRLTRPGGKEIIAIDVPAATQLDCVQIALDFHRYIVEDHEPETSGRRNLAVMELIQHCIDSSRHGTVIHAESSGSSLVAE